MSGRMLKRVLREQQAPQAIPEVEETEAGSVQTEEDEEDDGRSQKNTVRNRFDLLVLQARYPVLRFSSSFLLRLLFLGFLFRACQIIAP
jgi:hypothetical protein